MRVYTCINSAIRSISITSSLWTLNESEEDRPLSTPRRDGSEQASGSSHAHWCLPIGSDGHSLLTSRSSLRRANYQGGTVIFTYPHVTNRSSNRTWVQNLSCDHMTYLSTFPAMSSLNDVKCSILCVYDIHRSRVPGQKWFRIRMTLVYHI